MTTDLTLVNSEEENDNRRASDKFVILAADGYSRGNETRSSGRLFASLWCRAIVLPADRLVPRGNSNWRVTDHDLSVRKVLVTAMVTTIKGPIFYLESGKITCRT